MIVLIHYVRCVCAGSNHPKSISFDFDKYYTAASAISVSTMLPLIIRPKTPRNDRFVPNLHDIKLYNITIYFPGATSNEIPPVR